MQAAATEQQLLNQLHEYYRWHRSSLYRDIVISIIGCVVWGCLTSILLYKHYIQHADSNDDDKRREDLNDIALISLSSICSAVYILFIYSCKSRFPRQQMVNVGREILDTLTVSFYPSDTAEPTNLSRQYQVISAALQNDDLAEFLENTNYTAFGNYRIPLKDQPGSISISLRYLVNELSAVNIQGFLRMVDDDFYKMKELTILILQGHFGDKKLGFAQIPSIALSKIVSYLCVETSSMYLKKALP